MSVSTSTTPRSRRMFVLVVCAGAVTAGCVPMAKPMAFGESTRNAPPPPDSPKSAASILRGSPWVAAPSDPPAPAPDERRVGGAWRWTGTEYRWIAPRNEKDAPSYVWKRP